MPTTIAELFENYNGSDQLKEVDWGNPQVKQ